MSSYVVQRNSELPLLTDEKANSPRAPSGLGSALMALAFCLGCASVASCVVSLKSNTNPVAGLDTKDKGSMTYLKVVSPEVQKINFPGWASQLGEPTGGAAWNI